MNRWGILGLLFFARTAMAIHYVAVGAILPLLMADLDLNYAKGGTLVGLFMLPGTVLALPGGFLGLWLGDKRLTLIGLAVMTAGGVVFGVSHTFAVAAVGRVVAGVGSAFLNVILYKMAGDWFETREVSTATGLVAASWPLGMGAGLTMLSVLGVRFGWQVAVLAAPALSAVALLAMWRWYRDPARVVAGAAHAGALRHPGPSRVFPIDLTRDEMVAANVSGVVRMFASVGQSVFIAFAPAFLVARGVSITHAGFLVSLASWIMIGSTVLGGVAADRLRRPLGVIVVGAAGFAGLVMALPRVTWVAPFFLLLGVFSGLPGGPLNAMPGRALRPAARSVGFGIFFTWTYLGQTVLPVGAGWLADRAQTPAAALLFAAATTLLAIPGLGVFWWVMRARQARERSS